MGIQSVRVVGWKVIALLAMSSLLAGCGINTIPTLDEQVKEVRLSSRLTSSPACLITDVFEMTPALVQLYRASGQEVPVGKRILELNPTHPLVVGLRGAHAERGDDPTMAETAELLYEGEGWQSPIGTVRGIYASDPRENAQAIRQVWGTWGVKIRLMGRPQCLTPWVVYRQALPVWRGADLGESEAVAVGQVRYFSGDFWRCVEVTEAGQTPATHPAKWQVQAVPSRCAVYAVRAVAAALLRRAAQYERGGAEEAAAKTWLGEEMAKVMVEPNYFNQ